MARNGVLAALKWTVGGLAATAAIVVAAGYVALRGSLPPPEPSVTLAGLAAGVTVRFDARARPYVRAESLEDAFRAQGWLHATNRAWQMELLRRAGQGRLAELMGADLLDSDRELWRAGVPQLAARLERNADPRTRAIVDAYVEGVNAGLGALRVRPPEFLLLAHSPRAWTRADVFAVGAMVAFDSANNLENELVRLAIRGKVDAARYAAFVPDEAALPGAVTTLVGADAGAAATPAGSSSAGHAPASPASAAPPASSVRAPNESTAAVLATLRRLDALDALGVDGLPSAAFGSNGWVVAPARSRSGHALFAFDSHDSLSLPNLFYEVHLWYPGGSVRGWSVAGLPGVINGFNERIAWGFTNIGDTQDLYLEERDPADPLRFRGPDGWYRARVETVEIPVRGRDAPERLEIVHTRHGPLVSDAPALSLAWTAHAEDAHGLDGLLAMNLARDWPSFRAGLDRLFAPSANVTYADADGRIAFRTVGRLPVRGRGEGLEPLPAAEPGVEWQGVVPSAKLPTLLDPPAGYAAAANSRVAPPGAAPLVSADNATDFRLRRIVQVLGSAPAHDLESMRALQVDWRDEQAALLLPAMLPALQGVSAPAEVQARDLLVRWSADPVARPESGAPLLFQRWYLAVARRTFATPLGDELYAQLLKRNYLVNHALDRLIVATPDSPWWEGQRDERLLAAFRDAVGALAAEYGDDPAQWRWDAVHRLKIRHELGRAVPFLGRWLNREGMPWGGGTQTVGRANYRYDRGEAITHGATVRVVVELAQPVRAHAITPGGQSGHPFSAQYADQLDAWLAGRLETLARRPEDVDGATIVLTPALPRQ